MVNSQPKDDRRPGRPTREQTASIGKSVLVGARRVFCELGYAAASMDQIAAAVGVSKLTIYRRFPSKEALLIAVVDHYLEQLTVTADAKSEDGQSALDTLRETTRALFEASLEPEAILFGRLLVTEATKNDKNEALRLRFADWEYIARAPVRTRMVAAQRQGQVVEGDPAVLTGILCDLIDGLTKRRRLGLGDLVPIDPSSFFDERWGFFERAAALP